MGAPDVEVLGRRLKRRLTLANLLASGLVTVYLRLNTAKPGSASTLNFNLEWAATFLGFSATSILLAFWVANRRFLHEWQVLGTRPPSDDERDALLRQPWRITKLIFALWIGVSLIISSLIAFSDPRRALVSALVSILGGATASALTYLLVEEGMRPLVQTMLAGASPPRSPVVGVRPRLWLGWALGSGIPLVGVALTPLARERGADVPATVPAGLLAAAGVLAGIATTAAVTGSVSSPLQAIRRGLDRVGAGDLHAELAVDDAGEVGHIQAGFNRMVVGLRERQRLEDLFGRHVGEQVAQAAMERAPGLGGQLLDASLLFVDVAGSSRLATTTAPERLVEMLNDLFSCIVAAVTAEDGWVNKFEGDAALSVFGVPVDDADHAAHAVRAALAVACGVEGLRDRWPELEVGIGVSTGKVVAGNVGAMERYEFTVVGQPVNEAARLADAAKEHGERLLASRSILDAAGDAGDWEPLGDIALRGIGLVAVGRPRRMA